MKKRKLYLVCGYLTISVRKEIEATSLKEARRKADELAAPSLCHQCADAGDGHEGVWELNGFDDPPDDCVMEVEEIDEADR